MQYPDLKHCTSVEELITVVDDCRRRLAIPVELPAWPGQWAVVAKGLRWDSCTPAPGVCSTDAARHAERYLLMANILLDGEARHAEILRREHALQDAATRDAETWLSGWILGTNDELDDYPEYAEKLDKLTSLDLALTYARLQGDGIERRYIAMRTALRLAFGLWCLEVDGRPAVSTGANLKALANASNHSEAASRLGARRI